LSTLPEDVDGIICYPVDGDANSQAFLDLANSGYPLVLLDRAPRGCEHLVVQTDNFRASELAVTDLMDRGHRRIAFFGSSNDRAQSVRERFLGYRKTVESLDYDTRAYERWIPLLLEESSELMYQTISDGFAVMRGLPEPPTAAFCIQDRLASGVLDACQTYGLEVGIDFGVATFNDFGPSFFRYPQRIDRVVQRMEEVSETAISRLRALIRGEDPGAGPVRIDAQFFPAEDPRKILTSSLYAHAAAGPP
ncbi:LacI family transcriptional regulator, partial [bacterium]